MKISMICFILFFNPLRQAIMMASLPFLEYRINVRQIFFRFWVLARLHAYFVPGVSSLGVHPPILANQLTLSQGGGAHYAHQIILAPPDFQTLRRPWVVLTYVSIVYPGWLKDSSTPDFSTMKFKS